MKLDAQEVESIGAINREKGKIDGLKAQATDINQDELTDAHLSIRPQMESEAQDRISKAGGGRKINFGICKAVPATPISCWARVIWLSSTRWNCQETRIQNWMRTNITIQYLRVWERKYNPKCLEVARDELIETVHKMNTTLATSPWISTIHTLGIKCIRVKGSGTTAHSEIAEMFQALLSLEYMLELV